MTEWTAMKEARKRAGLTLQGLSHRSQLSADHLRTLEAGQCGPTAETIAKLEAVLGEIGAPPKAGPRRLTDAELAWAHEQRLAGRKLREVAKELKCNPSTLSGRLIDWADADALPEDRYSPGERVCLCCGKSFKSWDVAMNKVCGRCKSMETWG